MDTLVTAGTDRACSSSLADKDDTLWQMLPWFLMALTTMTAVILLITLLILVNKNRKLHKFKANAMRGRLTSHGSSVAYSEDGTNKKTMTRLWADRCGSPANLPQSRDGSLRYTKQTEDVNRRQRSNIGAWDASYRRSMSVDQGTAIMMARGEKPSDREAVVSVISTDSFDPAEYANMSGSRNRTGSERGTLPASSVPHGGALYGNTDVNRMQGDPFARASSLDKTPHSLANKPGLFHHPLFGKKSGKNGMRETVRMSGIVPFSTPEQRVGRSPAIIQNTDQYMNMK